MSDNSIIKILDSGYEYHAFISWCHSMDELGTKIVKAINHSITDYFRNTLRGGGKVFLDSERLKGGYKWESYLRHSLCHSAVTIVLLTNTYIDSQYCQIEFAITNELQKIRMSDNNKTCCIVILAQKIDEINIPNEISLTQYDKELRASIAYSTNFKNTKTWKIFIQKLADNIKEICEDISLKGTPNWEIHEKIAANTEPFIFTFKKKSHDIKEIIG